MGTPHDPSTSRSDDWSGPAGLAGPAGAQPTPPRPGTVVGAVVAWVAAGAVLILSGIDSVAAAGDEQRKAMLAERFSDADVRIGESAIEQLLIVTGFAGMVIGLFVIAFGSLLLSGTSWVRVAVVVAAVPGTIFVWPALFMLLGAVLQFLPSSNAWFRSRAGSDAQPSNAPES